MNRPPPRIPAARRAPSPRPASPAASAPVGLAGLAGAAAAQARACGLQGARLRLPFRRRRTATISWSRWTRRATPGTRPCGRRARASISRSRRFCRSSPRAAASPYGLHPALSAKSTPSSGKAGSPFSPTSGPSTSRRRDPTTLAVRPDNLFSHADQQSQWQSCGLRRARAPRAGAGAWPIASRTAMAHPASRWPPPIAGVESLPHGPDLLARWPLPPPAASRCRGSTAARRPMPGWRRCRPSSPPTRDNTYVKAAGDIATRALSLSGVVNPILTATDSPGPGAVPGTDFRESRSNSCRWPS